MSRSLRSREERNIAYWVSCGRCARRPRRYRFGSRWLRIGLQTTFSAASGRCHPSQFPCKCTCWSTEPTSMTSALGGRFWGRMAFARASHDDPEMTSFAPSALHTTAVTVWLAVAQRLASVVIRGVKIHAEPGWRSVSSVAWVAELRHGEPDQHRDPGDHRDRSTRQPASRRPSAVQANARRPKPGDWGAAYCAYLAASTSYQPITQTYYNGSCAIQPRVERYAASSDFTSTSALRQLSRWTQCQRFSSNRGWRRAAGCLKGLQPGVERPAKWAATSTGTRGRRPRPTPPAAPPRPAASPSTVPQADLTGP